MFTYFQHGRRHGEFGSDPVPFKGKVPFATIRNFGGDLSLPDHAVHYFDLIGGSTAVFGTSDSDIFSNGVTSGVTGSPLHGISVNQPGSYIIIVTGTFSGGTTGAQAVLYHNDVTPGFGYLSSLQFGHPQISIDPTDNHVSFFEFEGFPASTDVPTVIIASAQVQSGAAASCGVQMVVARINPFGSDAF